MNWQHAISVGGDDRKRPGENHLLNICCNARCNRRALSASIQFATAIPKKRQRQKNGSMPPSSAGSLSRCILRGQRTCIGSPRRGWRPHSKLSPICAYISSRRLIRSSYSVNGLPCFLITNIVLKPTSLPTSPYYITSPFLFC